MNTVHYINDISDEDIVKYGFNTYFDARVEYPDCEIIKFNVNKISYYFAESKDGKFYIGKDGFKKKLEVIFYPNLGNLEK